jgi:SAM-dependent methyltransferase
MLLVLLAQLTVAPVLFDDLPEGLRKYIAPDPGIFAQYQSENAVSAADRLQRGEQEHLAYYVLQARAFTKKPPIPPGAAAQDFHDHDAVASPAARARMREFLKELPKKTQDPRMMLWQRALAPEQRTLAYLEQCHAEAMRFLYAREVTRERGLYRRRGFSLDSVMEAGYAVWNGLGVVRDLKQGERYSRALVVGPGLEFSPRIGFREDLPVQSVQPFLVLDALLSLGVADPAEVRVDAVDLNQRVVTVIDEFRRRAPARLVLRESAGDEEARRWWEAAGRKLGPSIRGTRAKSVEVKPELLERVRAARMDLLTERVREQYDLIVVTNLLLYFDNRQLGLALANLASMLRPGGVLIHNEVRPEVEFLANLAGLPVLQARTIEIRARAASPLFDFVVIHVRK